MATLLLLIALPIVLLAFVRWEERDHPEWAVAVILGLLIVEALIYPSQNEVPGGLFHPNLASRAIRLPELMIPLALLARILVRGGPKRIGTTALAWSAFLAWVAVGLPIGVLMHNQFNEGFFQAKAVIYVGGGYALVSGIPAARLASRTVHRRVVLCLGIVAAICVPTALAGTPRSLNLPLIPGASFGLLSPDAATILSMVAIVALLSEAAGERRRLVYGVAAVPLLLSPFIATQRAAIVGLVATLLVLAVASVGRTWSRRIRATPTEAVLLVCILLIPVLLSICSRALLETSPSTQLIPYASRVTETFTAQRKTQSADTRENLWRSGLDEAHTYPFMGWGLGKTYRVERAAQPGVFLVGGGYHNILVDILVRRGLVGIVLFTIAVCCSLHDALWTWRRHPNRQIAVFCGACGAAFVGLLAKGMVESVFEKFRLATLLGLLIGAIASATASARRSLADDRALLARETTG